MRGNRMSRAIVLQRRLRGAEETPLVLLAGSALLLLALLFGSLT